MLGAAGVGCGALPPVCHRLAATARLGCTGQGTASPGQGLTCPCPHTHASQNVSRHHSFQSLTQGHQSTISLSAPSTHLLNIPRNGDSPTTLGSLCQCLTILLLKDFFLIFNLHLPLRLIPLVLSLVTQKKRQTPPAYKLLTSKSTLKVAGFRIPFDISWIPAMQKEVGLGVTDQAVPVVRYPRRK